MISRSLTLHSTCANATTATMATKAMMQAIAIALLATALASTVRAEPVQVPKAPILSTAATSRLDAVALNPQPLPPKEAAMLRVQMAMQRENATFFSVSNVLRTRHDTAKNAIGNVR
jgi:hypothetical protein